MKKILLSCMLAGLLFLLASCGINLNTEFSADKDFKGTRVMRCSISKTDLTNLNRDFSSVDSIIKEHCPDVMSYQDESDETTISWVFTLSFESLEDYEEKVDACLNFAPEITLDYQNTPFTHGLIYRENFTSRDLLAWFSENLIKEGIMNEEESDEMWNVEDALFSFDDSDYETDKRIDIDTMEYLPLDCISIYTNVKDGRYTQVVKFDVPEESLNADSIGIEEYLTEDLNPAQFQWSRKGIKNGRQYRITYSADTLKELEALAKKVLKRKSSLTCESTLDEKVPFQINDAYRHKYSMTAFRSSEDGKTDYKIYFKADQGQLADGSEIQDRYQLIKKGRAKSVNVSFQVERPQTFSDYRITTVFHDQDRLTRELLLTGSYFYTDEDMKLLSKRLKKNGFQTIERLSLRKLLLSVTGTPEEISSAYQDFLQEESPLSAKTITQQISRTQRSSVSDSLDLSGLRFEEDAAGTYYFISNCMESVREAVLTVDQKEVPMTKLQALEKSSISDASSLTHFKAEYKADISNGTAIRFSYSGSVTDVYSSAYLLVIAAILTIAFLMILLYRKKGRISH